MANGIDAGIVYFGRKIGDDTREMRNGTRIGAMSHGQNRSSAARRAGFGDGAAPRPDEPDEGDQADRRRHERNGARHI